MGLGLRGVGFRALGLGFCTFQEFRVSGVLLLRGLGFRVLGFFSFHGLRGLGCRVFLFFRG